MHDHKQSRFHPVSDAHLIIGGPKNKPKLPGIQGRRLDSVVEVFLFVCCSLFTCHYTLRIVNSANTKVVLKKPNTEVFASK